MKFYNIEDTIKELISGLTIDECNWRDFLSPDLLLCKPYIEISYKYEISDWEKFEQGEMDWDYTAFLKFIFREPILINGLTSLYILNDELIMNGSIAKICLNEFHDFAYYIEDKFQMNFFQPSDYIILVPEYKMIFVLHHSGFVFEAILTV
jgi:hypothetical protein